MQKAGISVYAFDAHSFGRSEPLDAQVRAYVSSVDHFVDDVYSFLQVRAAHLAHTMTMHANHDPSLISTPLQCN